MLDLKGKTALVTGASRGIGRGIAIALAEAGAARVALTYFQNQAAAAEATEAARAAGADAIAVRYDQSSPQDTAEIFRAVRDRFGGLDVFVANARPDFDHFFAEPETIAPELFEHAFAAQARAFHTEARHAARVLGPGGRIIAVTYGPGSRTGSWQPWVAMGSAKAAMESLVRYWAVALAGRGITVNAVSPGLTEGNTAIDSLPADVVAELRAWARSGWVPMRRLTTPQDVGRAVALLSTGHADFVTGQILYVDGGASLMDPSFPLAIQWPGAARHA
ncbi:MAG TPA: SDR family oxidoreductase [Candidatus Binatia bacterium]|nr:SDR family oxidoreductase [Candidatus Binatia bacterium]